MRSSIGLLLLEKMLGDHSRGIPGLSEPPQSVAAHDANQVLEALAEGLQVVLAAY